MRKDNGKYGAEISCVTNSIFHASMELSSSLAKRHIDNQHFHSISKDSAAVRVCIFRAAAFNLLSQMEY